MSAIVPPSADVVKLNLSVGSLLTTLIGGEPHVVFRPAVEKIGLSYSRQFKKIKTRSWANCGLKATVAEDGKIRDMVTLDTPSFLMWLATVNESRVSEDARPTLIAYQRETSGAVYGYWTRGGALNPRATTEQTDELKRQLEESSHRIAELEPHADAWKALASGQTNYSVRTVAHILRQDHNIRTGERQLFKMLHLWKWTYGNKEPYARYGAYLVKRMYDDYRDRETGEQRSGGFQLRVTPQGVAAIRRKIGS